MKHTYRVLGMTCASCVEKVKKALLAVEGVSSAEVELKTGMVQVSMSHHIGVKALQKALRPLKKYSLEEIEQGNLEDRSVSKKTLSTYWPLILVVLYIIGATAYLSYIQDSYEWTVWMPNFMGLFFLAFGFFKLLDVPGFAASYLSYDIPTKEWPIWGYIYPFVEVALGLSFLLRFEPLWTNVATVLIMGVSIIGVIQSVLQKRAIKCACLGTGFNLPMSTVTIMEDGLMIAMAGVMVLAQIG